MAGGKKRKLASDSMADSGTTNKKFDHEKLKRMADSLLPKGSDKKFDEELNRMAASLLPKGSDKIVDYEKLKRMAASRLPKGSDKKFDHEKLKRMANSLLPKGSDKKFDEELNRMANSLLPKGSDKKFDEKLKRMADSLLPKGSDKIVDERAFNALPVSRDVDEVRLQLSREEVAVVEFNNKRFYKFCPVPTSETPVAHQWKMSRSINGYDGGAHGIF